MFNISKFCPDRCPICWFDIKADGYPTGHQQPKTGDQCEFRWDVESATQAELAAEAAEEYEAPLERRVERQLAKRPLSLHR